MDSERLREMIESVMDKPYTTESGYVYPNGRPLENSRFFYVKTKIGDQQHGYRIDEDFASLILRDLDEEYRKHIVAIKHDGWLPCSYELVFDEEYQSKWDENQRKFYDMKARWCEQFGCE